MFSSSKENNFVFTLNNVVVLLQWTVWFFHKHTCVMLVKTNKKHGYIL